MKTFYSAYTCIGNIGDLLINKLQIEEYALYGEVYVDCTGMPEYFKSVIFRTNNPNIKDFVYYYGCSYRSIKMFRLIRLLKKHNFTHFTKSPGPYAVLKIPLNVLFVRLIGFSGYWYAKKMGLKVFAVGIDLDYKTSNKRWLIGWNRKYFNIYDFIAVRSWDNYIRLKDELSNISYIPDMAFLNGQLLHKKQTKRIAFSFRTVKQEQYMLHVLKGIANYFIEKGYYIDILFQVEEDAQNSRKIYEYIKKDESVTFFPQCIKFEDLKIYGNYDYVFSNRLHVLLMSSALNVVPLAIISENLKERKIANIFHCSFRDKLCFYIDEWNNEILNQLVSRYNEVLNNIHIDFAKNQHNCKAVISSLFSSEKTNSTF